MDERQETEQQEFDYETLQEQRDQELSELLESHEMKKLQLRLE